MIRTFALLFLLTGCAPITASAIGGPSVTVNNRKLVVDGTEWFEVHDLRQQFLRTLQVMKDGRLLLQVSDLKSSGHLITAQLENGRMFEARSTEPPEAFVSGMIRDGVLTPDGTVDELAFRNYAKKIGANSDHLGDWDRMQKMVIVNRHPRAVRFTLQQRQLEGNDVEEIREVGPQASGNMTVLMGDVLCITGTQTCVTVERGLKSLVISLDGVRFE